MRNAICIFGLEDLSRLAALPHLFANKFMPDFDAGALVCWYERLFNRTYETWDEKSAITQLDPMFYKNLPHVRFNELKRASVDGRVNLTEFDCELDQRFENDN